MQKFRLEATDIEEVGSFVYIEIVVSESGRTEEDVTSRNKKANGVFVQLWRNLIHSFIHSFSFHRSVQGYK